MTDREIAQAIRRADADALRHQLEDSKIVLCEAGIALHRRYGWGSKRIGDFVDVVQEVEDECSADPKRSMIQILDEETGIEIKPDADGPGWRDLAFLNADVEHEFRSIPEYRCMRSRQIRWIKPTFTPWCLWHCIVNADGEPRGCGDCWRTCRGLGSGAPNRRGSCTSRRSE